MTMDTATDARSLPRGRVDRLRAALRGPLLEPGSPGYEQGRAIYNGMIDRRPALIAGCADVADVMRSVDFARASGVPVAIRGGGHSGPGLGLCDDGLVIDLSAMRGVRVDPDARTARVEGGCRWGDVDHATHAFGLATVSGIVSTTGVGGLTLGGGHGYLTRKHGLTIDNLIAADVVLADGRFVQANEREHADLFWALRGGGGNFGVVTSFLFRLHPVHTVFAGPTLFAMDDAANVLRRYGEVLPRLSDDVSGFFLFMVVPPAPPFPAALHGRTVCGVMWCALDEAALEASRAALREVAAPVFDYVGPMPYPELQSMFDPLYPPGLRWYWKGDFVRELDEDAIAAHVAYGRALPTPLSTMHLYPIDGAASRVPPDATAFAYRDARWSSVIVGVGMRPEDDARTIDWAREYWRAVHPKSAGGAYVNFMMDEGQERIRATYGANYDRLVAIKTHYDPHNFFRNNQNIWPAVSA
jgi:FAD/FMN-containing dehydrogenase